MFRGRGVFLLDLISNSLGAVLLLFLLLISRHFDRPPPRIEETLVVLAEAERSDARLGLWVEPPGRESPRLFTEEITGLEWRQAAGGYRRRSLPDAPASLDTYFQAAKFLRAPASAAEADAQADTMPAGAGMVVPRPATGCWVFAPYYEDSPGLLSGEPVETPVRVTVWLEGLLARGRSGADNPQTRAPGENVFRAPTSQDRHCIEITESGVADEPACCRTGQ